MERTAPDFKAKTKSHGMLNFLVYRNLWPPTNPYHPQKHP